MSITKSILTTLCIFTLVWTAVFLNTRSYRATNIPDVIAPSQTSMRSPVTLTGIEREIDLSENKNELSNLWEAFYEASDLHLSVGQEDSKRVFAYYEFNGVDLNSATVLIGYNNRGKEIAGYSSIQTPSPETYELIYEGSDSWDTTPGWNEISGDREAHSILEAYLMDAGGDVTTTQVYVLYKP